MYIHAPAGEEWKAERLIKLFHTMHVKKGLCLLKTVLGAMPGAIGTALVGSRLVICLTIYFTLLQRVFFSDQSILL